MVSRPIHVLQSTQEIQEFLSADEECGEAFSLRFASRSRVQRWLSGVELLKKNKTQIVSMVCSETGKSVALAEAEFQAAITFAELTAYACFAEVGSQIRSAQSAKQVTVARAPLGNAVLISSYNTPLPNLLWKLAPSYLAGNRSLVCPSQYVLGSTQRALECLFEAGISSSDLAHTDGSPDLAEFASRQPSVRLISFTGSNAVGRKISENCAKFHPKLILEMGGTNPILVLPTANVEKAAEAIALSAVSNGGQRCAAGTIVLAHSAVASKLRDQLVNTMSQGSFADTLMHQNTPLISEPARQKHEDFIESQIRSGSSVIRFDSLALANASTPVLIENMVDPADACSEELFSPAIRFIEVESLADAISFANKLPLRLTAAVWTGALSEMIKAQERLEFGLVNVNGPTFGSEPNFPFGGMGVSGNGTRDAGFNALIEYSQTRVWTLVDSE